MRTIVAAIAAVMLSQGDGCSSSRPVQPPAPPVPPVSGGMTNADASARAVQMTAAFERWARANGVERGAMAIVFNGQLMGSSQVGGRSVFEAARVASLSKAITAVCASRLIDSGALSYDTTVGQALAPFLQRIGPPRDARLANATVGQLIGHRSGIRRVVDLTTSPSDWGPGMRTALEEQARRVLKTDLNRDPGSAYEYSNAGYMLLSYIIAATVNEPYEVYCRRMVLEPLGTITARLDPEFPNSPRSGAGGWTIAAADYARFADRFRSTSQYGPATLAWLQTREAVQPFYALGYQRQGEPGRYTLHHNGLLTEPELSTTAQFAVWPSGLTMALNTTPHQRTTLTALMVELNRIAGSEGDLGGEEGLGAGPP